MVNTGDVQLLGDEKLHPEAAGKIRSIIRPPDKLLAWAGFDWGNKVIALTDQAVSITDSKGAIVFTRSYHGIVRATHQGRSLVINTSSGNHEYQMGNEEVVASLARYINNPELLKAAPTRNSAAPPVDRANDDTTEITSPNIAERVRFWEEQDKINQELIPRVIRQHELLTSHIADHENLPLIASNAIRESLAEARQQQQEQHEAEIAEVRAELQAAQDERQRQAEELADIRAAATEQARQHAAELQEAQAERQRQAEAMADIRVAATEQARQHATELEAAKAEREEQARQHSNEVAALQEQFSKTKTLLLSVATGAGVISVAALVVSILL